MSKAMQLVGIILLSIFTLVIIYLMSDVRSTNELDYYLLQEVTEASMYDAVDYSYYRETGLLKVDRDMFLENFNRRFAESVDNDREYEIKIIDFNETPPKVSVEVTAPTVASVKGEVALVTNRVSGIIETIYDDYVYSKGNYGLDNYDDERPEITVSDPVNNNYSITMTDNYMLEKYAIVELGDNGINQFTDSSYNQITNWINIKGYVNSYSINQTIATGKNGLWVVAVDRGGLWTAVPITDNNPYISNWVFDYKNEGKLSATFKDDRGLASYTVTPVICNGSVNVANNGKASCNGNWIDTVKSQSIEISGATIKGDGYYTKTVNNIDVSTSAFYAITVTDNREHKSEPLVVQGNRKHEIKIDYTTKDEVNFEINISDSYGDLAYYQVSDNVNPSENKWEATGSSTTVKINKKLSDRSKNYYIHAKDNAGKKAYIVIEAKKESQNLLTNAYTIKHGCSGVWKDDKSEGCFSDKNGVSWSHSDNTLKSFKVNTNDYSKVTISVSNLNFKNMSKRNSAPNCAFAGVCRYNLVAIIGGKETVIKSWKVEHQKNVSAGTGGCILTGRTNSGNITLDLNQLGIKNTGEQTLELKVTLGGINGLYYFEGNINQITLES